VGFDEFLKAEFGQHERPFWDYFGLKSSNIHETEKCKCKCLSFFVCYLIGIEIVKNNHFKQKNPLRGVYPLNKGNFLNDSKIERSQK